MIRPALIPFGFRAVAPTTGFRAVAPTTGFRAVALGGGHGLHATLTALRELTTDITAVVTVADDGGSSGRIRRELGLLPPGDLRMALSALAGGTPRDEMWSQLMQHRFGGAGALAGHPVGNLLLAGLMERYGDPLLALDEAGRLIGARRARPADESGSSRPGGRRGPHRRRPRRAAHDPRPVVDRDHGRTRPRRCECCRPGRPPARPPSMRFVRRIWSCSARARGSRA